MVKKAYWCSTAEKEKSDANPCPFPALLKKVKE
jgi:hypothetical protein